jgi:hypothetical protein
MHSTSEEGMTGATYACIALSSEAFIFLRFIEGAGRFAIRMQTELASLGA